MAVTAVEEFHRVNVTLTTRLPRPGRKGIMEVIARAEKWNRDPVVPSTSVSRNAMISGGDPVMVAATIFRLVYDLDKDCGAMWAQAELFESV